MQMYKRALPALALATCRGHRRLTAAVLAGLAAASLSGSAFAQCDTYTIAAGPATFIAATTPAGIVGDDATGTVTLPFDVTVYGATYPAGSTVVVGSNGFIDFGGLPGNPGFSNACLPRTTGTNYGPVLYPHWDDLRTDGAAGGIFTDVVGTAPNRTFVVEWQAVYFAANTTALNFEVQFHESSSDIDFVYNSIPNTGVSATVGAESQNTGPTTQWSCNTPGAVSDGMSLRLTCGALLPGACCAGDGTCSLVTQPNCALPNTWNGGSACSPNPCPQPPANDDCATAEVIGATPFAGSVLSTPSSDDIDVGCNAGTSGATRNGVWYLFTAGPEGGRLTLGETGPNDVVIGVFSGADCNTLTEIACFDAEANDNVDLLSNATVWILVGLWSSGAAPTGTYNLTASYAPFVPGACCNPDGSCSIQTVNNCAAPSTWTSGGVCDPNPCPQPPANDNCSTATVVTVGTVTGSNSLASNDGLTLTCGGTGGGRDVWFSFTATADSVYNFDTAGSAQADTILALFDACGGTQLACNDDGLGLVLLSRIEYSLTTGQTVYIRLSSYGPSPAGGGFNLNIFAVGSGACCGNNTAICNITTATGCTSGNTYLGDNTTCDASPCGTLGACCSPTGECNWVISLACTGYYAGEGTVCDATLCTLGACCDGTNCTLTNQAGCTGTFMGAGTSCDSATPYGNLNLALGIPDYTGVVVPVTSTISTTDTTMISDLKVRVNLVHTFGGDFHVTLTGPNNTVVDLFDRPGTASCTPGELGNGNDLNGSYTLSDSAATNINAAFIAGPSPLVPGFYKASTCNGVDVSLNAAFAGIPVTGDWTLTVSDEDEGITGALNSFELVVNGGTIVCQPTTTNGACCAGAACSVTDSASCTGANTHYAGDNTTCNAPGNNTSPCCKADYNQSGSITVQDIFDFLGAYFTQNPQADINASSTVTVQDIFDFLSAYFTGCV